MRPLLILFSIAALLPTSVLASPTAFSLVGEDFREGRADRETYLLERFRLAFAREKVAPRYAALEPGLPHCFTETVTEYVKARESLGPEAVREIEGYLSPILRSTYVSPSGTFELNYETTGADAVPLDDVNPPNGIPDFVERCAEYFDTSWDVEITTLGFFPPELPVDGTYDVNLVNLAPGLFGFMEGQPGGTSEITIDNNFVGTGHVPSDDPDGAQLGRAKGVIAHEFKHASQWTNSGGSESGLWRELDANWIVDVVFDDSNIYHAWCGGLAYSSNLTAPWVRLDNNTQDSGSYEDLLWQTYLSETYGNQIIVDFWDIRRANPAQSVKNSYRDAMTLYGTDWTESFTEFMEWTWFTGSRAEPPFGFEEAPDMLRMRLREPNITAYPFTTNDSVDRLASHPRRFNPGTATGSPQIVFNGDNSISTWTVSILAEEPDGTFTIVRPALDANNDFDYTVPMPWSALTYTGVIVNNTRRSGGTVPYTLQVLDGDTPTDVEELSVATASRLTLRTAAPNPFAVSTLLQYTLPAPAHASLEIYDVTGRVVRTLVDGELPAGEGEVVWNGRSDAGRPLPNGVYWSRLETDLGSVARKIVKLD